MKWTEQNKMYFHEKESIRDRHWIEVMTITNSSFDFAGPEFRLQSLLDINMVAKKDEIEEVTDGADKQVRHLFNMKCLISDEPSKRMSLAPQVIN